jgi:hypothetical protein
VDTSNSSNPNSSNPNSSTRSTRSRDSLERTGNRMVNSTPQLSRAHMESIELFLTCRKLTPAGADARIARVSFQGERP